jgi:hypothetical protein
MPCSDLPLRVCLRASPSLMSTDDPPERFSLTTRTEPSPAPASMNAWTICPPTRRASDPATDRPPQPVALSLSVSTEAAVTTLRLCSRRSTRPPAPLRHCRSGVPGQPSMPLAAFASSGRAFFDGRQSVLWTNSAGIAPGVPEVSRRVGAGSTWPPTTPRSRFGSGLPRLRPEVGHHLGSMATLAQTTCDYPPASPPPYSPGPTGRTSVSRPPGGAYGSNRCGMRTWTGGGGVTSVPTSPGDWPKRRAPRSFMSHT